LQIDGTEVARWRVRAVQVVGVQINPPPQAGSA
jgi:hypothetical protein